jgi:hypothetical protein
MDPIRSDTTVATTTTAVIIIIIIVNISHVRKAGCHVCKIFEASHAEQTHHCHKNITTLQLLSVPIASPHR